jgi:hypothetical protein
MHREPFVDVPRQLVDLQNKFAWRRAAQKVMQRAHAREHAVIAREHAVIAREHAVIAREHVVIAREHVAHAREHVVFADRYTGHADRFYLAADADSRTAWRPSVPVSCSQRLFIHGSRMHGRQFDRLAHTLERLIERVAAGKTAGRSGTATMAEMTGHAGPKYAPGHSQRIVRSSDRRLDAGLCLLSCAAS